MSSRAAPVNPEGAEASVETAVEIAVDGRYALALSELLIPFHSCLFQKTAARWVVRARAPGSHSETLGDALSAIAEWRAERGVDASVRVAGRPLGSPR